MGVDSSLDVHKAIVIGKMNEQFLIASDNGIVPMVFEEGNFIYKRIEDPGNDYFSFDSFSTLYQTTD